MTDPNYFAAPPVNHCNFPDIISGTRCTKEAKFGVIEIDAEGKPVEEENRTEACEDHVGRTLNANFMRHLVFQLEP